MVFILTVFTLLFVAFTTVLYLFLFLVKKELIFTAKHQSLFSIFLPILLGIFAGSLFITTGTLDEVVRGVAVSLAIISYAINGRGIASDRFVIHPLDNRGIKFDEVDRVVLFRDEKKNEVKMNFFKFGLRGPLMKFSTPMDELVKFLSKHLKEGTPIDVVMDSNNK
ncbi:hypothetical protein GCM10025886_06320 [Tetragenococcus halophilus subsp. flandriensis]|nr:hypothetical protein GCM10025886_06320 [Tetragenococcus halophilus subsp. flandriensis]